MKWLAEGVRGLSPAYFALVMATGIVSIAADRAGFHTIALVLLWLNAAQYLVLWILTLWRLLRYRRALLDDLTDHRRAPGVFSGGGAPSGMGDKLINNCALLPPLAPWVFWLFVCFFPSSPIFPT